MQKSATIQMSQIFFDFSPKYTIFEIVEYFLICNRLQTCFPPCATALGPCLGWIVFPRVRRTWSPRWVGRASLPSIRGCSLTSSPRPCPTWGSRCRCDRPRRNVHLIPVQAEWLKLLFAKLKIAKCTARVSGKMCAAGTWRRRQGRQMDNNKSYLNDLFSL